MAAAIRSAEGWHTRLVRLGRLVLPVLALVLLSTVFLLARSVDPEDAIPFADVDVSERARDRQLTAPRLSGVSTDGVAFDLSARLARPETEDPNRMTADTVRLVLTGDGQATVTADNAHVDTRARNLRLDGDVRIDTSTGYRVQTDRLEGSLGHLRIVAPGEVTGEGPLGQLRAGAMTISEDAEGGTRLLFNGGVDLLYTPPS